MAKKVNAKKNESVMECGCNGKKLPSPVFIQLMEDGIMPKKEFPDSAGYDVFLPATYRIGQGKGVIPLGFKMQLPAGKAALLFARSGVASKGVQGYLSESNGRLCNVRVVTEPMDEQRMNEIREKDDLYFVQNVKEFTVNGIKMYQCTYRTKIFEPIRLEKAYIHLGMVDCGFRGEVGLIVENHDSNFFLERGQSIAQMVIIDVPDTELVQTDNLGESEDGRGEQGFNG